MKTTSEDFRYFKQCCQKWIIRLGLLGWQVYYFHEDRGTCYACINANDLVDRTVAIYFCKTWDTALKKTKAEINQLAKHEIIELLICRARLLAYSRFSTKEHIEEAFHEIIFILEGCVH